MNHILEIDLVWNPHCTENEFRGEIGCFLTMTYFQIRGSGETRNSCGPLLQWRFVYNGGLIVEEHLSVCDQAPFCINATITFQWIKIALLLCGSGHKRWEHPLMGWCENCCYLQVKESCTICNHWYRIKSSKVWLKVYWQQDLITLCSIRARLM